MSPLPHVIHNRKDNQPRECEDLQAAVPRTTRETGRQGSQPAWAFDFFCMNLDVASEQASRGSPLCWYARARSTIHLHRSRLMCYVCVGENELTVNARLMAPLALQPPPRRRVTTSHLAVTQLSAQHRKLHLSPHQRQHSLMRFQLTVTERTRSTSRMARMTKCCLLYVYAYLRESPA